MTSTVDETAPLVVDRRAGEASVRRALRTLATLGAAVVLVIIVASAYMRLTAAGLSCADWPACYGRFGTSVEPTTGVRIARAAHRLAATAAATIVLALAGLALVARPRRAREIAAAIAALALVAGLAVLGIATSKLAPDAPPLPAVTLANFLGGFVLLALIVGLRAARDASIAVAPWVRALARVALVVVALQITLGGFVSARFAGLACPAFPLCGTAVAVESLPALLDPLAPLAVDATHAVVRTPALATLQWAHRIGAHLVLFLAIPLAIGLLRGRRFAFAAAVFIPVVIELALGASAAVFALPLAVVLAHNLVAALLLATLVETNVRLRAPRAPEVREGREAGV